jgi:small subunit ribosomal protein S8
MMTDPIADMLTRIRNASAVKKREVIVPFSKIKMSIAGILVNKGYLASAEEKKEKHPYILVTLKFTGGMPAITNLKRISKPGHRRYVKSEDIKEVLNGFGTGIYSTPKGLLTDEEARKMKVGGELICEVY